ncbi:MAG: hypothetical protein ACM3S5_19765 [Rhodospirillales bacterium]
MKRRIALPLALVVGAVWALVQAPAPRSLAGYIPAGPLLVLEARDFAALLRDWNGSAEKKLWLASANFEVFSRSRLYQRLADAHKEFAAAAGFPPDMSLLDSAAGDESVLALYDIGKLEFLYITRLPSARAIETVLWRTRANYETRQAAGVDYFVRVDPASRRIAAFAATNDYLLIATREDLIPAALNLLAGSGGSAVTSEEWYAAPVRAARQRGELRLVMNLAALVRSPYFRSYWVQRNASVVRQFNAGIADVFRSPAEIREERVLLRFGQAPPAVRSAVMGQALRLVPDDAGLFRAWANPTPEAALDLLLARVLDPQPGLGRPSEIAPAAPVAAVAGTEADLETRIDEPPLARTEGRFDSAPLRKVLEAAGLQAMMETGATRVLPEGVFVNIDSAVALIASSDWDAVAVRNALSTAAETGPLGRIAFETSGRVLVIGNSAELVKKVAARAAGPAPNSGAAYAAAFNAASERPNFERLTTLVDSVSGREPRGPERQPRFFSENIASLGRTLGRVQSVAVVREDAGNAVTETVTYRLGQP